MGKICLERLKQLFHQAAKPAIPPPPSKVLCLLTLKIINTFCRYVSPKIENLHSLYLCLRIIRLRVILNITASFVDCDKHPFHYTNTQDVISIGSQIGTLLEMYNTFCP